MRASPNQSRQARRRGAVMILVAVLMPVFALMAAFAVDVAWMQLVRTELRSATDAAARAGAKTLSLQQSRPAATAAALDAASRNQVAGQGLALRAPDVVFGNSTDTASGVFTFAPNVDPTNAVHVDGRRTVGSAAGPVSLFFGGLLGVRQFEPVAEATSTMLDRDLCLVLDRSLSMAGSKIVDLKAAVGVFLDELDNTFPREQVALVSYSTTSRIDQALTFDMSLIAQAANSLQPTAFTAIGMGLQDGIDAIQSRTARPFAVKTIVLMTDGIHNTGIDPRVVARRAAAADITVHTVTFGFGADITRMRAVADTTGGKHFHAATGADLSDVFREIARTLPVLLTE